MRIAVSKIRQPRKKAQTLKRVRLVDLLHQNIHRKLTFVCAPAGFGKTTLLSDFAEDVDARICWYQIGLAEASLPRFYLYLVRAIQQSYPDFGAELEEGLSEDQPLDPIAAAIEFNNALIQDVNEFTLVVLDDYHLVSQTPEIVIFLEKMIEQMPEQVRVLIGSRNIYGIPSAELYVQSELTTIAADSLAFTIDELVDLARTYFQVKLERLQARVLIEHTEGWIMGILVALRGRDMQTALDQLSGSREDVFSYFYDEIIQTLEPELVDFMMITSLFDEFDQPLMEALLPDKPIAAMLQQLIEQNLFISQLESDAEPSYQYHQMFRSFLAERAARVLPPQFVNEIQIQAAKYLLIQEANESAIQLFLQAGDLESAAALMDELALDLYTTGQYNTLLSWSQDLEYSPEATELAPRLFLNVGKMLASQGKRRESIELFDKIEPTLRDNKDWESLVNLLANKGISLRFLGEAAEGEAIGVEMLAVVKAKKLPAYYQFQAERLIGLCQLLQDQDSGFDHLNTAAEGIRGLIGVETNARYTHELVMVLADIGHFALQGDDIYLAQKSFSEAVQLCKENQSNQGDLALSANNQGYTLYLIGDYAASWQKFEMALDAASTSGWQETIVNVRNSRGDLLLDVGLIDEADTEYNQALSYANNGKSDLSLNESYIGLSHIARINGQLNDANTWMRRAAEWQNASPETPAYMFHQAWIWASMQQFKLALDHLSRVTEILADKGASTLRAQSHMLMALVTLNLKQDDRMATHLDLALQDAALLGYDQYLMRLVREHQQELKTILKKHPYPQIEDLLNRAGSRTWTMEDFRQREPEEPAQLNDKLSVTGLGNGLVRVNGERVSDAQWKSVGARALFFYILEMRSPSKDQIALEFWPEFSSGKVNSNFHATLWRVRNALGSRDLICQEDKNYFIAREVIADYDVTRFQDLANRMHTIGLPTSERRQIGYQVLDIYQGDFLSDLDMPWIDERRNELARQFDDCLTHLASLEFEEAHFDNARRLFQTLISRDSFQEENHMGYMRALIALKDRVSAKHHYEQYSAQLREEMGLEPGSEMTQLYQSL